MNRLHKAVLASVLTVPMMIAACGDDAADPAQETTAGETQASTSTSASSETGSESGESSSTTEAETGESTETGDAYDGVLENWCSSQPENFSFFITSMDALWTLSGDAIDDWSGGFGGNYGGIEGADAICQEIAHAAGHNHKTWRAFLSATDDGTGQPINAIERIGQGPWYDANGRMVASGIAGLLADDRPDGDPQSTEDLPDECGVPLSLLGNTHDIPTGSNQQGQLNSTDPNWTCNDWTSNSDTLGVSSGGFPGSSEGVMIGHSYPRETMGGPGGMDGANWLSDHPTRGCGKGANLIQDGAGSGTCIGCSGGYGALYCFAVEGG